MKNINEKNVKKLIEGANVALMMTNKGLIAVGSTTDLLFLYSEMARLLSQNNIPKEALSTACEIGIENTIVDKKIVDKKTDENKIISDKKEDLKRFRNFLDSLDKLFEEFDNE